MHRNRKRRKRGTIVVEEVDMVESQSTQRPAWQCVHTVAAAQTEQKTMSRRIAHPSNPAKRARPAAFSVAACSRADHMETSDQAIRDVAHVLRVVASCCLPSGSPQSSLRLWDPYYCQGTVKVHFKKLIWVRKNKKLQNGFQKNTK